MKIGIVSDLHLEFYDTMTSVRLQEMINECEADHVVIAGDIHPNKMFRDYFLSQIEKPKTVVLGNHDYYGSEWYDDFVENDLFVGGCLWTNFGDDPLVQINAPRQIYDFRAIKNWGVDRVTNIFWSHLNRIIVSDRKLVATHFAPSLRSVEERFRGDSMNPYFCNDLDSTIEFLDKKLWVHGHVHSRHDYMIGNCQVVANPLGYPNEISGDYEVKIVEVDVEHS